MNESLIQPGMFKMPGLTQKVVLFFSLQHFTIFHKRVTGSGIKSFGPARRFQWEGSSGKVTALGGIIGAPLAVMVAEMAMASGAETVYAYGSAGSTGAVRFETGELIIPEFGFDETGICRDYTGEGSPQDFSPGFDVKRCRAVNSVNSFFRLTRSKIDHYRQSDIQLIDMEASPLNCVIRQQAKSFFPLFVVSDRVTAGYEWINSGNSPAFKEGFETGLDLIAGI